MPLGGVTGVSSGGVAVTPEGAGVSLGVSPAGVSGVLAGGVTGPAALSSGAVVPGSADSPSPLDDPLEHAPRASSVAEQTRSRDKLAVKNVKVMFNAPL